MLLSSIEGKTPTPRLAKPIAWPTRIGFTSAPPGSEFELFVLSDVCGGVRGGCDDSALLEVTLIPYPVPVLGDLITCLGAKGVLADLLPAPRFSDFIVRGDFPVGRGGGNPADTKGLNA